MAEEATKKRKKLSKIIDGKVVVITEGVTGTVIKGDFNALPKDIQEKLGPYGLSQKLGDAAAGKEGKTAVDSINKVLEGLMKGDWSVRAPAAEKVSKKDILAAYEAMQGKEKEAATVLLKKFGLLK